MLRLRLGLMLVAMLRYYWPKDIDDLASLQNKPADVPIYFLGAGSNVIIQIMAARV